MRRLSCGVNMNICFTAWSSQNILLDSLRSQHDLEVNMIRIFFIFRSRFGYFRLESFSKTLMVSTSCFHTTPKVENFGKKSIEKTTNVVNKSHDKVINQRM